MKKKLDNLRESVKMYPQIAQRAQNIKKILNHEGREETRRNNK